MVDPLLSQDPRTFILYRQRGDRERRPIEPRNFVFRSSLTCIHPGNRFFRNFRANVAESRVRSALPLISTSAGIAGWKSRFRLVGKLFTKTFSVQTFSARLILCGRFSCSPVTLREALKNTSLPRTHLSILSPKHVEIQVIDDLTRKQREDTKRIRS